MKLIVFSSPEKVKDELSTIEGLFAGNLEYFHLRKPNYTKTEYELFLQQLPPQYLQRVILHNYHELVEQYPVKGVHYTHYTNNFKYLDPIWQIHRSKACHSLAEILNLQYHYDYIFLSPIYNSISKENYPSKFDFMQLKEFFQRENIFIPTIALGGIDENKVIEAKEIGFAGVAILGTIWQEDTTSKRLSRFHKIQNKCKLVEAQNLINKTS